MAREQWKEPLELVRLDAGLQRLLPQLYRNLSAAGAEDPVVDALRRTHQKTWAKNRVLFRDLAALLSEFRAAGIETLLLKGAALIPIAYRDYGSRPMTDLDVLVPPDWAAEAIRLLRELGWRSILGSPEPLIGLRHADDFVDARQCRLDLHWSVLQECCGPGENDDFWQASVPIEVEGVPTRALCPADQLLHVCVHGARSSSVQPVGWIADAMVVLRSSNGQVDWTRLLEQARKRRLTVPIRHAMRYLHTDLSAAIPSEVLETLETAPTSTFERVEYRVKSSRRELVGSLPVLWFDYWRVAEDTGPVRKMLGFPRYLQRTFRLPTLWRLPFTTVALAMRRIRARSRRPPRRRGLAGGSPRESAPSRSWPWAL